jgi:uncharacterized membrane protein YhaH (DUF805 family)
MLRLATIVLVGLYLKEGRHRIIGSERLSGRRSRLGYLAAIAVLILELVILLPAVVIIIQGSINGDFGFEAYHDAKEKFTATMIFVTALLVFLSYLAISAQRCRDFGWTGWSILISLLPVVGGLFMVAIFFIPGSVGSNRYGPNPIPSNLR